MEHLALDIMMAQFIKGLSGPVMHATYVGSYIFGAYLIAKGLLKSVKYSDEGSRGQQKFSGIWGSLFVGAALLALPGALTMISTTMGMDPNQSEPTLSYVNEMTDQEIQEKLDRAYWTIIAFVQMLGLISFVRGLSILRSVTDGNTQVTSMAGITHVLAGGVAWNLGEFVQMLGNTIGYAELMTT